MNGEAGCDAKKTKHWLCPVTDTQLVFIQYDITPTNTFGSSSLLQPTSFSTAVMKKFLLFKAFLTELNFTAVKDYKNQREIWLLASADP